MKRLLSNTVGSRLLVLFSAVLILTAGLSGCGGASGGGGTSGGGTSGGTTTGGTGTGGTTGGTTTGGTTGGTATTGRIEMTFALAKQVPGAVTLFRFTARDSSNAVVLGPLDRASATRITLEGVSLTAVSLLIEYVNASGSVVGRGEVNLTFNAGVASITDPDYQDINQLRFLLKPAPGQTHGRVLRSFPADSTVDNVVLTRAILVEVANPAGARLASFNGDVTLSGELIDSVTVKARDGVATFPNVKPRTKGVMRLTASSEGLGSATSDELTVGGSGEAQVEILRLWAGERVSALLVESRGNGAAFIPGAYAFSDTGVADGSGRVQLKLQNVPSGSYTLYLLPEGVGALGPSKGLTKAVDILADTNHVLGPEELTQSWTTADQPEIRGPASTSPVRLGESFQVSARVEDKTPSTGAVLLIVGQDEASLVGVQTRAVGDPLEFAGSFTEMANGDQVVPGANVYRCFAIDKTPASEAAGVLGAAQDSYLPDVIVNP